MSSSKSQIILVNLFLSTPVSLFDLAVGTRKSEGGPGLEPVCPSKGAVLIFTSVPKARRDQVCPRDLGSGSRISGKVLLA
jgi:hypothetical protein